MHVAYNAVGLVDNQAVVHEGMHLVAGDDSIYDNQWIIHRVHDAILELQSQLSFLGPPHAVWPVDAPSKREVTRILVEPIWVFQLESCERWFVLDLLTVKSLTSWHLPL